MDVKISDLRVDFGFGLKVEAVIYKTRPQQDRYERCLIRIRDNSGDAIKQIEIRLPAEYARSMAHEILEANLQ